MMAMERAVIARLPPIGSIKAQELSPRRMRKYDGLSGPNYTVGGRGVTYNLPPPATLKPLQDTTAGTLDTWPAHATGNSSSMTAVALTKDKRLRIVDEEAQGKPQMVPKPRFLEQLEAFLKKELVAMGVQEVGPSELRLQAHREVFEYLIEDFKTYKPLLSAIKNEYEMMLSYQRELIRHMEPLKQMLVTVSEQCDQKIMALREEEKQEVIDLKKENKSLCRRIDGLHQEQVALETQVEKLQEELAAEYLKYRDECDARKMLVSDINELRYQQEDILMSKNSMEELDEGEKDDPVTLKIALRPGQKWTKLGGDNAQGGAPGGGEGGGGGKKGLLGRLLRGGRKAREDEAAATRRVNEMEANYGDVIPRRDYEQLQKNYNELEDKLDQLRRNFKKLQDEHAALQDAHQEVTNARDKYYLQLEELEHRSTPRPDWDKCADYITGGIMKWKEHEGKSSNELVDVLLAEIAGSPGAEAAGAQFFDGLGTGDDVPKYLRFEGKVRNRYLGKRDTTLLVKDIWREKAAHDAEQQEKEEDYREDLAEFVHIYLTRRFAVDQMVVEWAYNLHDACQRYAHDERIGLFWSILSGEADEGLYHSQLQMHSRLENHLTKLDVERGNQGVLAKADLKEALQEFFPQRDEENIVMLVKAAETELDARDADTLDYKSLFYQEDEARLPPFIAELNRQFKADRLQYIDDIRTELGDASLVEMNDLKRAITIADPEIDASDMDRYLCWTFHTTRDQLPTAEAQELTALLARMRNGNIHRIGQKMA